jgi:predicted HAD superfamily phosphohydrolase
MIEFSGRNIEMIPQADQVLRDVMRLAPAYIVSTSYSPYIEAVCSAIGLPFANTYSTEVNLDADALAAGEEYG